MTCAWKRSSPTAASWRARSPATRSQVEALLKAALSHRGTAVLDIISPCVTFNDHEESTKSYAYGKAHEQVINDFTFVPARDEITVDYAEGETADVIMHDGSHLRLKKLDQSHDPTDRFAAMRLLEETHLKQEFITGLIYVNEGRPSFPELERLPDEPLAHMPVEKTRPSREALAKVIAEYA